MTKVFVSACPACGTKTKEQTGALHRRVEGKLLLIIGVPHFPCTKCDTVSYRKEIGMNELIKNAVRTGSNFIMTEEEDY